MRKKWKGELGFTLIEMLIVIFIIGLIIAIALPNLKSAGESARVKADHANRNLIGAQIDHYYLQHGIYPKSVEELVNKGYLRSVPSCPWGEKPYVIRTNASTSEEQVSCQ